METLAQQDPPPVVTLEFEGPGSQRRLTVAFRLVLAIPHFLYSGVLSIAVFFAIAAAWFAALVIGRMPDGLGAFVSRVIQYMGRVQAYGMLLLTDKYPSFALDEPDYAVSVHAPYGGRLNRAAVLFRAILLVPAALAQWLAWTGLAVCLVFIWLIVLISGRIPRALFEAEAATLRYQLRTYAFAAMLTSEYPRGLFGDRGLASDADAPPAEAFEAITAEVEPATPPARPRITKLVLSTAGRRLVVLFIVLGAIFGIGMQVLSAAQLGGIDQARDELGAAYDDIVTASNDYGSRVQSCAVRQGGAGCLHDAADRLRAAFVTFQVDLREIEMPPAALAAADRVDDDVTAITRVLAVMATTEDPDEYDHRAAELGRLLEDFDQHLVELDEVLAFAI